MKAKSFLDILEEQIRAEVRKELEQELDFQTPQAPGSRGTSVETNLTDTQVLQMDLWLSSHLDHSRLSGSVRGQSAYRPLKPVQPEGKRQAAPERRVSLTPQHSVALELICRFAEVVTPKSLTFSELKSIWRRAALKTHPDRVSQTDAVTQARATAIFRELSEAHDILSALFCDRVTDAA